MTQTEREEFEMKLLKQEKVLNFEHLDPHNRNFYIDLAVENDSYTFGPQTKADNVNDYDDLDSEVEQLDLVGYTINKKFLNKELLKDDYIAEPLRTLVSCLAPDWP